MIMPPNVIRVFCNPSEPSVSHSVSKKQLCAILHCSTLMLIEKCHAVFRLTTRLSSQERTSLNLGSTVVCLQRLIQSLYKRCPNPTHALSLQCTVPKKQKCKHPSQQAPTLASSKHGGQPQPGRRCHEEVQEYLSRHFSLTRDTCKHHHLTR